MVSLKKIITFAFILLLSYSGFSQMENHVSWKFEYKDLGNNVVDLIFKGKIDDKWDIYSINDELNPITFAYEKSNDYTIDGKVKEGWPPKKEYDKLMEATRHFYFKKCEFHQKIKANKNNFTVNGTLDYQSCLADGMCVMSSKDFSIKISLKQTQKTETEPNNNKIKTETSDNTITVNDTSNNTKADTSILKTDTEKTIVDTAKTTEIKTTNNTNNNSQQKESNNSLWWFFFISFGAGLMAILTPCVFPMIPMTVSFFMHNGESKTKSKIQAIFYGVSIILIYTIIGTVIAVTLGVNFANWLSTHWIPNVAFFLIFLIFAMSFFGMFEITLPSWMVNKSDKNADKGGWTGTFFMAFTLVLVSFSCTGPIVGAILVESASGEILKPIIGMFGFSLAFALPFTFFAFFPSLLNKMPKSGGWLNSVKVVLGFLELALGLKFLSIADQTYHWHILDREIYLAIWIVIFTLMGLYLLGKLKFAHDSDLPYIKVPRLIMAIITFTFVVYMIPGMFGAPLKALAGYLPPQESIDFDINKIVRENLENTNISSNGGNSEMIEKPKYSDFLTLPHGLKGYFDYEQALRVANKLNKPVFVDFTGHGCVNCREMEAAVWSDPKVLKRLKNNFVVVALYVDDKTELPESEWVTSKRDGKIKKTIGKKYADLQITKYNINAQPYYVLLDKEGNTLNGSRAYNKDVDAFVNFLDEGLAKFNKKYKK